MKTILLGGLGMKMKHLQKYSSSPSIPLTYNSLYTSSVKYGHHRYASQLKQVLLQNEKSILHVFSAASWFCVDKVLHDETCKNRIAGVIMESNPYYFDEKQFVKEIKRQNKILQPISSTFLENGLKLYLDVNGATPAWRYNYLEKMNNIDLPTMVIASKEDQIIPYNYSLEFYNSLSTNKELFLSDTGQYCRIIRDNPEYIDKIEIFKKNL